MVCRTGAAGLSGLGEVEDLTLSRSVLRAVVLHEAVDLETLHVCEDLRALRTLQAVSRLLREKYDDIQPPAFPPQSLTVSESVEGSS